MKVNSRGYRLICEFEGFRAEAYRDAVGMLTIGYGHTERAGLPVVTTGMRVTRTQARRILERDVASFAAGVRAALRVTVNDNQFSALVSFAYNVGLQAFQKSSVLAAVNRGEFAAVPRRLALWVKAGGAVLPGLVRRRAAESALFMESAAGAHAGPAPKSDPAPSVVGPLSGKAFGRSTTNIAAMVSALVASLASASDELGPLLGSGAAANLPRLAAAVVVVAAVWIIRERCLKASREGI